ncbi:hypothetical protein Dimus_036329 [Dionaea muscipula]
MSRRLTEYMFRLCRLSHAARSQYFVSRPPNVVVSLTGRVRCMRRRRSDRWSSPTSTTRRSTGRAREEPIAHAHRRTGKEMLGYRRRAPPPPLHRRRAPPPPLHRRRTPPLAAPLFAARLLLTWASRREGDESPDAASCKEELAGEVPQDNMELPTGDAT